MCLMPSKPCPPGISRQSGQGREVEEAVGRQLDARLGLGHLGPERMIHRAGGFALDHGQHGLEANLAGHQQVFLLNPPHAIGTKRMNRASGHLSIVLLEVGTDASRSRDELHKAQKLGTIPFTHHDDGVCFVWTFAKDTERQPVLHAMPKQGEVISGRNLPAGGCLLLSLGDDLGRQVLQQRPRGVSLSSLEMAALRAPSAWALEALELPVKRQFALGNVPGQRWNRQRRHRLAVGSLRRQQRHRGRPDQNQPQGPGA